MMAIQTTTHRIDQEPVGCHKPPPWHGWRAKQAGSIAGLAFAFTSTRTFHYFLKPEHLIVISFAIKMV